MYKGLPAPWDLESGILLSESRILLTIRIWNPRSSTGKESKSGIHGQAPLIDKKFEIQNQEIGIHSLKSRIQGYLGLPYKYVGRFLWHLPLAVWLHLKSFHFAGLLLLVLSALWGKFPWNFQGSAEKYFGGKQEKVARDHDFRLNAQSNLCFSWRYLWPVWKWFSLGKGLACSRPLFPNHSLIFSRALTYASFSLSESLQQAENG